MMKRGAPLALKIQRGQPPQAPFQPLLTVTKLLIQMPERNRERLLLRVPHHTTATGFATSSSSSLA